jgi:Cys-tRNA(Pro)/Cys-tRNA(Cys) deacylase
VEYTFERFPVKTNAARILDGLGIRYELREYAVGDGHLDACAVVERAGLPAEQVWKTLVVRGDRHGVALAVVPGDAELELFDVVSVSAGARGTQILLAPRDHLRATRGKTGEIARRPPDP